MEKPVEINISEPQDESDFCDHGGIACPFCGRDLRMGHDRDGRSFRHEMPVCHPYVFSQNANNFSMLLALKVKSDLDQRERN